MASLLFHSRNAVSEFEKVQECQKKIEENIKRNIFFPMHIHFVEPLVSLPI